MPGEEFDGGGTMDDQNGGVDVNDGGVELGTTDDGIYNCQGPPPAGEFDGGGTMDHDSSGPAEEFDDGGGTMDHENGGLEFGFDDTAGEFDSGGTIDDDDSGVDIGNSDGGGGVDSGNSGVGFGGDVDVDVELNPMHKESGAAARGFHSSLSSNKLFVPDGSGPFHTAAASGNKEMSSKEFDHGGEPFVLDPLPFCSAAASSLAVISDVKNNSGTHGDVKNNNGTTANGSLPTAPNVGDDDDDGGDDDDDDDDDGVAQVGHIVLDEDDNDASHGSDDHVDDGNNDHSNETVVVEEPTNTMTQLQSPPGVAAAATGAPSCSSFEPIFGSVTVGGLRRSARLAPVLGSICNEDGLHRSARLMGN